MPLFPRLALPTTLLALTLLALVGCGGPVAMEAPALLTTDQIAARAEGMTDTAGGARAASELAWRAAQLRLRAERLRGTSMASAERTSLLRRADELKADQR